MEIIRGRIEDYGADGSVYIRAAKMILKKKSGFRTIYGQS